MKFRFRFLFRPDVSLIILIVLTALFSSLSIWCAEPLMNSSLRNSNLWLKQLIWNFLGALLFITLYHLDPYRIKKCSCFLSGFMMIFLFLLFIDQYIINLPDSFIRAINGTTAWIQIPGFGSFQPSEFIKIALIVRTGFLIQDHFNDLKQTTVKTDMILFIKIIKQNLIPLILILVQPDTGIPIVILASTGIMLMTSPIKKNWIVIFLLILSICFAGIILLHELFPEVFRELGGYRLRRISGWLAPEETMKNEGYQLYTSLMMISGCGIFGCGLRQFVISVPEAHTDFIFTVIAQNFGLAGTLSVLMLCLFLDITLARILLTDNSALHRSGTGLLGMLIFQQVQNISMVTGLLPVTGIPLPLLSYGGSSVLSTWMSLALFFILSKHSHRRPSASIDSKSLPKWDIMMK